MLPLLDPPLLLLWASVAQAARVAVPDEGHAYNPHWSLDGRYLAFELNRYGDSVDLYVVRVQDGVPSVPVKLVIPGVSSAFSTRGTVLAAPVWHPEGHVLFEGTNAVGAQRLYFWSPGGPSATELFSLDQIAGDLSWPSLSPDGRTLAFVSDATGNGDIYLWDQVHNRIAPTFSSVFAEASPEFSPDGTTLVFSRKNRGSEDLFTWTVQWEGGGATPPLLGGNGDQSRPVWVGDQVVYFTNERGEGHWDIAVVPASGGQRRILAREIRLPMRASPALTPDGRAVVYTLSDPERADRLMVTTLDGSRTVEIPTGLVACGEPDVVRVGDRDWVAFTALENKSSDWRQLHVIEVTGKLP